MIVDGKKRCARCGLRKPLDAFHRHATSTDGRQAYCKVCQRRYASSTSQRQTQAQESAAAIAVQLERFTDAARELGVALRNVHEVSQAVLLELRKASAT